MRWFLPLLLSVTILVSCRNRQEIVTMLDVAKSVMAERPDSARGILSSIDRRKVPSKRLLARHALLYSQALDKCYVDVDKDTLIRVAVDYYSGHGNDYERALAHYYHAVVRGNASDIEGAIHSLTLARIFADKTDDEWLQGMIYMYLGDQYYNEYSFNEAVDAYYKAIERHRNLECKDYVLYEMYNCGTALHMTGKSIDAIKILLEAKDIALEDNNVSYFLDIIAAMSTIHAHKSINTDITPFKKYKYDLLNIFKKYTCGEIPIDYHPLMGYVYYQEDNLDSARIMYHKYYTKHDIITPSNIGMILMLSKIETRAGNYERALNYGLEYIDASDSLNRERHNHIVKNLDRRYKTEYLEKSYAALRQTHIYATVSLVLAIAIIMIVAAIIIISSRRAIRRKNDEIVEYKHFLEEGQHHFEGLTNRYNELRSSLTSTNERTKTMFTMLDNRIKNLQEVLELASTCETNPDNFHRKFKEYLRIASDNNPQLADDVITLADLSCNNVITNLREKYPSLSHRELCYCGFVCLGFSAESIRILYNHTNIYSIYTMRSKIRNKMGVTSSSCCLETHLKSLTNELPEQQ